MKVILWFQHPLLQFFMIKGNGVLATWWKPLSKPVLLSNGCFPFLYHLQTDRRASCQNYRTRTSIRLGSSLPDAWFLNFLFWLRSHLSRVIGQDWRSSRSTSCMVWQRGRRFLILNPGVLPTENPPHWSWLGLESTGNVLRAPQATGFL